MSSGGGELLPCHQQLSWQFTRGLRMDTRRSPQEGRNSAYLRLKDGIKQPRAWTSP